MPMFMDPIVHLCFESVKGEYGRRFDVSVNGVPNGLSICKVPLNGVVVRNGGFNLDGVAGVFPFVWVNLEVYVVAFSFSEKLTEELR